MDHYKSDRGTGAKCENIKNGGTQFKKNYTPTNYRKKTSSQGTFIKNFIKMRFPKPSIPPPITFIMFLPQISKIIPQKMDAAGGGGKEKQTFFLPPAIPQVSRELR